MLNESYWFYHSIIGILYWAYNLLVRKLHTKNEPTDAWVLVPLWLTLWPLCFILILSGIIHDKIAKTKTIFNKI